MRIEKIELHQVNMPLVNPFETSFGRETSIEHILVAVYAEGIVGWGECVADKGPWYASETNGAAWHVIRDILVPLLYQAPISSPAEVVQRFQRVRGHPMARAALENAIWDWFGRAEGRSLASMLGSVSNRAVVGVSIGIEPTVAAVVEKVAGFVAEGYRRVKLKIKPGFDLDLVAAVRERWPDLLLQVDANSAYQLEDAAIFRAMDRYNLLLIEQPLHHEDIVDHAKLQAQVETPICLDESIHSFEHARWAVDLHACRVINIKVGRVGGLTAATQIHDLCAEHGIAVWCGGMLETNIGRSVNLALSTMPNFTLPGDLSASARYYTMDVALPNFELNPDSTISLPPGPGHGVTVQPARLAQVRNRWLTIEA